MKSLAHSVTDCADPETALWEDHGSSMLNRVEKRRATQGDERGHRGFLQQPQIVYLKRNCCKISWAYLHSTWGQVLILWVCKHPMKEKWAASI